MPETLRLLQKQVEENHDIYLPIGSLDVKGSLSPLKSIKPNPEKLTYLIEDNPTPHDPLINRGGHNSNH